MPPRTIIDSHIHLWPEETSDEQGHAWMTPGMPLAKPHVLSDYYQASHQRRSSNSDVHVKGAVYIETDVRYDSPSSDDLATWARGPLDEIIFLCKIVAGEYGERDSRMLLGLVPWAPMNQSTQVLEEYLVLAKDMAGPSAWPKIKGFRFLLQSIVEQKRFEDLVFSEGFIANLKLLGQRRLSFDVGVDHHSGGIWQLEAIVKAMERAHQGVADHQKVIFIVNHLCKPDFSETDSGFGQWCAAMNKMSKLSKTYMKLSGAFSELPPDVSSITQIADCIKPWVAHIFATFGPKRVMFGSDWPVCNVKGHAGEGSWSAWTQVVEQLLDVPEMGLSEADRLCIWHDTAHEAYRIA
ncbi:hypothetical protein B0A50_00811 [Salinomyces thailandicus]|uniref:Amidohydrolase-related domain-containing protein n=1 Tax=Salinomyces thailandicus TaxID=706561 RepID=A0A4U0UCS4_9PEZI|nr:hypothetical protein B0A50_00811 [Salinomyces thailandica]